MVLFQAFVWEHGDTITMDTDITMYNNQPMSKINKIGKDLRQKIMAGGENPNYGLG